MRCRAAVTAFALFSLFSPLCAFAQWQLDGAPVSTTINTQSTPVIVSDGAGGAVVAWADGRNGNFDIYAQRLDAAGIPQWTADGIPVCAASGDQYDLTIASDGTGGAIVTWIDYRNGTESDIYAQRVLSSGSVVWTADGVALCTASSDQYLPIIVSDGSSGAVVTWIDYRGGMNSDIYAQRVDGSGIPQWPADGVALCMAPNSQLFPKLVGDGFGGAIVTWQDERNDLLQDVYAQRVDALGVTLWTSDGVALCTASGDQRKPVIDTDGSGGAIVAWDDPRDGNQDIYVQRIDASGVPQWTADGVALCTYSGNQEYPAIVSDGLGGAIVAWHDYRTATGPDVYVRRVTAAGAPQWSADGVALSDQLGVSEFFSMIVPDGSGGAIVAWKDDRDDTSNDVYARRVDAAGIPQWTNYGVPVCTVTGTAGTPGFAPDGSGGIIATWYDGRAGGTYDVYAQRIEGRHGYWGTPEPVVTSVADVPGDQGGKVKVNWAASGWDVLDMRTITHYSVWRATDPVTAMSAVAANPALLVEPSEIGENFSGRAYRIEHTPAADYYWELVGSQSAQYFAGYRLSADTSADSTSLGTMSHYFQVLSHTSDNFVFWPSNVVSGYSVDNLAPSAPLMLTAQRIGPDVHLIWDPVTSGDLRDYAVYRAMGSGVDPVPMNYLSGAHDTLYVDTNAPGGTLYYIVTAIDIHENESAPSNEASVSPATGVDRDTPTVYEFTVRNYPNPFRGTTEFQIGLTGPSTISIDVYDVIGHRVRSIEVPRSSAGWQQVPFDARDDSGRQLASGVYFYRVTASGIVRTRKMVIAR